MGCGCSKQVEVTTNNPPAEKETVGRTPFEKAPVQEASDGQAIKSSSCINQENGESVSSHECPRSSNQTTHGETGVKDTRSEIDRGTKLLDPSQDTNKSSSAGGNSLAVVGSHPPSKLYEIDYRQLFKIIKAAVYINDIRQITSLRNDIEEMKEDIQNAALKSDGDLPPIPEDESNVDNPRRVRPTRNHAREKTASIALEVSTAYRILENAGLYIKDTVEIEKLRNQYGQLQDYFNKVRG